MRMQEALDIIHNKPRGFLVHFEWIENGILRSDFFPDIHAGETLIRTEREAWELAERFAKSTKGRTCNIYVIDSKYNPVKDYELRLIENR